MIEQAGLDFVEVPRFEGKEKIPDSALGIYSNYLEIGNFILSPFSTWPEMTWPEIKMPMHLKLLRKYFQIKQIEPIHSVARWDLVCVA